MSDGEFTPVGSRRSALNSRGWPLSGGASVPPPRWVKKNVYRPTVGGYGPGGGEEAGGGPGRLAKSGGQRGFSLKVVVGCFFFFFFTFLA